jgi:hypothetical protein
VKKFSRSAVAAFVMATGVGAAANAEIETGSGHTSPTMSAYADASHDMDTTRAHNKRSMGKNDGEGSPMNQGDLPKTNSLKTGKKFGSAHTRKQI